jgi:nitroreductase
MDKTVETDHPIHNILTVRWSPYVFSPEPVPLSDIQSLFEAARWAPSSFNEQPWRYIVGIQGRGKTHQRILGCLTERNQDWARRVPVLALGVVVRTFAGSGQPNKAAEHDLGLASANLVIEATARKLFVHQMIGIVPETARREFAIPENAEALTGLAIGYRERDEAVGGPLRVREAKTRTRRPLSEFVFSNHFGGKADF